jgi:hypothetical protein
MAHPFFNLTPDEPDFTSQDKQAIRVEAMREVRRRQLRRRNQQSEDDDDYNNEMELAATTHSLGRYRNAGPPARRPSPSNEYVAAELHHLVTEAGSPSFFSAAVQDVDVQVLVERCRSNRPLTPPMALPPRGSPHISELLNQDLLRLARALMTMGHLWSLSESTTFPHQLALKIRFLQRLNVRIGPGMDPLGEEVLTAAACFVSHEASTKMRSLITH